MFLYRNEWNFYKAELSYKLFKLRPVGLMLIHMEIAEFMKGQKHVYTRSILCRTFGVS